MIAAQAFDRSMAQAARQRGPFCSGFTSDSDRAPLSRWRQTIFDTFYDIDVESPSDEFRVGKIVASDIGPVRAGIVHSDPIFIERRLQHINLAREDYVFIPIVISGSVVVRQLGRQAIVEPGKLAFLMTAYNYQFEHDRELREYTIRIPAQLIRERYAALEDAAAISLPSSSVPVALFLEFASTFCQNAWRIRAEEAPLAAQNLLNLFVFALSSVRPGRLETTSRAAIYKRAVAFIEANLGDHDLGIVSIAATLGISRRYLQNIFSEHGETITQFVRRRRLMEARMFLAGRMSSAQSVASIAYRVGFLDPSHFAREFRREFGSRPSEVLAVS